MKRPSDTLSSRKTKTVYKTKTGGRVSKPIRTLLMVMPLWPPSKTKRPSDTLSSREKKDIQNCTQNKGGKGQQAYKDFIDSDAFVAPFPLKTKKEKRKKKKE